VSAVDQLPFARILCCDSEYTDREDGNPVIPACVVAKELRSGQEWRVMVSEFGAHPPFPTDKQTLFVTYSAPAELGVFAVLGWPYPKRILDLFAEHRININGLSARDLGLPDEDKELLWKQRGAMILHGLDPTPAVLKDDLYERMKAGPPFTHNELTHIANVCALDVRDLARLFERMLPRILGRPNGLHHAIHRGMTMTGVAAMQHTGIPIDTDRFVRLCNRWDQIRAMLAADADREYGIFDGQEIDQTKFAAFLEKHNIAWPRTPKTNKLCTDKDTFKDMARGAHQALLNPLKETLVTLGQMRLNDLRVGSDGRNRCSLKPFWAKTGRNQPSSSQYVFGNATWYRGLIRPPPGRAILYADWACQEIGIEGACSGDQGMLADLATEDFYISFGIRARRLPHDAIKDTHELERGPLKTVALGVGYGMKEKSLAERLAITNPEARELLRLHRRVYPRFWQWNDDVVQFGRLNHKLWTTFGWELKITGATKVQTLRNFLMQSNGSEMLRFAFRRFVERGGFERGYLLVGPVHDALLVECAIADVNDAIHFTRSIMEEASRAVLNGFTLRIDFKVWKYPDRFMDEKRGRATWNKITGYLRRAEQATNRTVYGPPLRHGDGPPDSLFIYDSLYNDSSYA
jgi:DNA polymerase I